MKTIFSIVLFFFIFEWTLAQEYKNLKTFQEKTSLKELPEGAWLKKDRKQQTIVWENANVYNLLQEKGETKYHSIRQIRDFYLWFDNERIAKGHQIKAAGIAGIVAGQLSILENWWILHFVIRNKEVHRFGNEGSKLVLAYAFPLLKEVYLSSTALEGETSKNWDILYATNEQCVALEPLYQSLSPRTIKTLDRMAKGKGIYCLGVPNRLRFEGEVMDCQSRANHAMTKVFLYYEKE